MAFIPVPETAKLTLIYANSTRGWTNTFNFQQGEVPVLWTEEELGLLIDALEDTWSEALASIFCSTVQLVGARATSLQTESSPSVLRNITTANTGSIGQDTPFLNVAMSVTLRTGRRGRSYRGRIYHFGTPANAFLDKRRWSASAVSAATIAYSTWMSAMAAAYTGTAGDLKMVVASRQENGTPRTEGVATAVSQIQAQQQVATQRRRVNP